MENEKIVQTGNVVKCQRLIGWCLSIFGACIFLVAIPGGIISYLQGSINLFQAIGICIVNMFFGLGMIWMGSYWLGLYPDIEIGSDGLNVKSGYIKYPVRWQEILDVVEIKPGKTNAIVFSRRGMLLNRMYGSLWAGVGDQPVILVRQGASLDNWKATINYHAEARSD